MTPQPSEQPRTAAGRRVFMEFDDLGEYGDPKRLRELVLAIEAEAISLGHKEGYLSRAADEQMRAEAAVPDPTSEGTATCPVCGSPAVMRLPDNWQEQVEAGAAIPIVGCGNPWHYFLDREAAAPDPVASPEKACPDCGHDVDHTTRCPEGCPMCAPVASPALDALCTFGAYPDVLCGRVEGDRSVHSPDDEKKRPGTHLWRHEPKKAHRLRETTPLNVERLARALSEYGAIIPASAEYVRIAAFIVARLEGQPVAEEPA